MVAAYIGIGANLGNAALKLGQKGEAFLAYRRAERLIPRDKDLRWNTAVLKSALADRIESDYDQTVKELKPFLTP